MTTSFDPSAFEAFDVSQIFDRPIIPGEDDNEETPASPSEEQTAFSTAKLKATIFVIDCSSVPHKGLPEALFQQKDENSPSPWVSALDSIINYMRSRIIATKFDKVGVVLFGVDPPLKKDEDEKKPSHSSIKTVIELDFLNARNIKEVTNLRNLTATQFRNIYGLTPNPPPLSDLFWAVSSVFTRKTDKGRYASQLILLEPNDNPSMTAIEKRAAVQRAKDCLAENITIDVIPFGQTTFNCLHCFAEIMGLSEENTDLSELQNYKMSIDAFLPEIRRKEHAERIRGSIPFTLFPGFTIGLNQYTSVQEAKPPAPILLDQKTKQPLKVQTKYLAEDTGEIVTPAQLTKYLPLPDDEKLRIETGTLSGLYGIKGQTQPHLTLLGFKPRTSDKWHHRIKNPMFLYPETKKGLHATEGGDAVVAALIAAMREKDVIGIARYVPRRNVMARLVALYPQFEAIDEANIQVRPPGLHLIPLPFADDLRSLNLDEHITERPHSSRRREVVGKMLRSMEISAFDPESMPNPAIQQFYSALEALALDMTEPPEIIDVSKLDRTVAEAMAPYVNEWGDDLLEAGGSLTAGVKKTTGKAKSSAGEPAANPAERAEKLAEVQKLVKNKGLPKLKVPELKALLAALSLPVSGKKADLITRLETAASV